MVYFDYAVEETNANRHSTQYCHRACAGRGELESPVEVGASRRHYRYPGRAPWFIMAHVIWFCAWMPLNSKALSLQKFDAYPYPLLTMIVSLEAIFLSLFVLMSQNRSSLQAEQRAHLDLQINLLSETENTKMLQKGTNK